jgi:cardiolipin synthase
LPDDHERESADAGWRTWANAVTVLRLALIPVYLGLLFDTGHRALSAWLLVSLGGTDWIDGWIARRFNQTSTVGKILDPTADRVLVATGIVSVALAGGVPWWFASLTLLREVLVSVLTVILALLGATRIDVLWWGKVSTFILMGAFPLFLLTSNAHHSALLGWQSVLRPITWVFATVGLVLAWVVFMGYVGPARKALVRGRAARRVG